MREWDFSEEEAEELAQEYNSMSREEMLRQIKWKGEETQNFAM